MLIQVAVPLNDTAVLDKMRVWMALESCRSGHWSDVLPTQSKPWRWGADKQGAVILFNNDDDDGTYTCDHEDAVVNSDTDRVDIAPVRIVSSRIIPKNWCIELSVDRSRCIRIFNGTAGTSREILGGASNTHVFTPSELKSIATPIGLYLGMEATCYPDQNFDGLVTLTLKVTTSQGKVYTETGQVRTAPWMIPHHGVAASHVYVAKLPDNQLFRQDLYTLVQKAGCTLVEIDQVQAHRINNSQELGEIGTSYSRSLYDLLIYDKNYLQVLKPGWICIPEIYYLSSKNALTSLAGSVSDVDGGRTFTRNDLLNYRGRNPGLYGRSNRERIGSSKWAFIRLPHFYRVNDVNPTALVDLAAFFEPSLTFDQLLDRIAPDGRSNLERLFRGAATLQVPPNQDDRWMQDCMEIGYSSLPRQAIASVLRAPRNRPLRSIPSLLLSSEVGYHERGAIRYGNTFDSHGNLEVTPPCISQGKNYPFGRIYYGPGGGRQIFDPKVRAFLREQKVQAPFEVDTNWLTVGHVDEIITFVPDPSGGNPNFPYKLLLASPKKALDILRRLEKDWKCDGVLVRRLPGFGYQDTSSHSFPKGKGKLTMEHRGVNVEIELPSSASLLKYGIPNLKLTAQDFLNANNAAQGHLDKVEVTLKRELGLVSSDIIRVPILYIANERGGLDALTPAMVNMLVLNLHCLVPNPFGPLSAGEDQFAKYLRAELNGLGLHVHFIDDWDEYHVLNGEVHCGTNTRRKPPLSKWWEFIE